MAEEDSVAVEETGGVLLGIGTATDWTKEDVGVHSVVLGDAGEVAGHLDSKNHVVMLIVGVVLVLGAPWLVGGVGGCMMVGMVVSKGW